MTRLLTALLLGLLLFAVGCIPLIPRKQFLSLANDVAFAPELMCEQLKVDFGVPDLPTVKDPAELGIPFEKALVKTADDQILQVWYVPAQPERGVILLAYGAVGELRCYLLLTKHLHADGWSMVMYDFQGFGGSTGRPSFNTLVTDHTAVLDWTLARTGRDKVTLMGISVGTLPTVAQAAARPEAVNAVVLDGLLVLRLQVRRAWLLIGGRVEHYMKVFDPRLRIEEQLARVHQPIFAVVYGRDEYAKPAQIRQILSRAPGEVTIIEFPNLMHARGPYLATDEYFARLQAFLAGVWEGSGDVNSR